MSGVTSDPTYRAAYDAGCAEIDQIVERLTSLRSRKETMEKAIAALKLVVELGSAAEVSRPQAAAPVPVPAPAAAQPVEQLPPDRMQQHIDQVLRSLATV
jgi:hypothetical protein